MCILAVAVFRVVFQLLSPYVLLHRSICSLKELLGKRTTTDTADMLVIYDFIAFSANACREYIRMIQNVYSMYIECTNFTRSEGNSLVILTRIPCSDLNCEDVRKFYWGRENPLSHLHEDEAPVQTDKLTPLSQGFENPKFRASTGLAMWHFLLALTILTFVRRWLNDRFAWCVTSFCGHQWTCTREW